MTSPARASDFSSLLTVGGAMPVAADTSVTVALDPAPQNPRRDDDEAKGPPQPQKKIMNVTLAGSPMMMSDRSPAQAEHAEDAARAAFAAWQEPATIDSVVVHYVKEAGKPSKPRDRFKFKASALAETAESLELIGPDDAPKADADADDADVVAAAARD